MSKFQINVKSSNYARDKEAFLKDLKQFNESKGIPFKTPNVNGVDIDLYLFYSLVQQRGGLSKVNQTNALDTFLRPLRLPHPCINGSTLLRRIYGTYLEKYERARGPPGRDDDDVVEDDFRRTRGGGGMPRVTFSGAYIADSSRQSRSHGPPERLALSLLSPMPNEQDFAVNVCSVLAADLANRLPLSSTPHILDFLLAHAGVYNHESLRTTIGRSYYEARGVYPDEFWKQRAGGGGARELADETRFSAPGLEQPELMVQALAAQNTLTDCLAMDSGCRADIEKILLEDTVDDWVTEPSEEDQLFAPQFPGGSKCVYTQRVLQIASIVRSLSFHEENVPILAKNTTLLRFLLLCANSWVGTLRQSGLDTLGNVSTELVIKEPATCLISRHVLSTIQAAMVSSDRARVLAALELLNKLAQNENNEDVLLKALEPKIYEEVCALLTLRDIMVLVCTLECVYALTSLGERACECVAKVRGLVSTLVSLVTVEAQSYGPRACILMRVVETVSGPNVQQTDDRPQTTTQPAAPQAAPPTQATPTKMEPRPQTQQTPVAVPSVSQAPAVVPSIQQQHLQQQQLQENEQFALAWLRASYEPLPINNNSGVEASDVYRQYVACCTKMGRKGMLSSAHIPRLIRTLFGGSVGPNTVTTSTGETQQMYIGIRCRNPPPRGGQTAGPSSPILKAQLTNKTGTTEVKTVVQQPQTQQVSTHPQFSQAIDSGSSTTLIKHLLANKVSPAPHVNMQVAQRQQNQMRVVGQSNTVVMQTNHSAMEVDPEALIKCTTITPGGVASSTPIQTDKIINSSLIQNSGEEGKEEPVQIQIDEQSQLTIKTSQNKMLADLLEKKSNPPVQVVQMTPQQLNAPTIQITETGQIVQVKPDNNPVIQINPDILQMKTDSSPVLQINPETGQISQIMQVKSESGPMIQITPESQMLPQPGSYIQVKNEQGQIIHLKNDQGQIIQIKGAVTEQLHPGHKNDADADEPPNKRTKVEEKQEKSPQESVSKTAANLYAALAASALEDEEDLMPPKQEDVIQQDNVLLQEPILQVQQPTMQVQQPTLQVQAPTLQVQQPMLQVQPMDMQVQNIIASQGGQLILQEKPMSSQSGQYVQQQMQLIATPNTSQGGLSYITQNIQGNMMQPHKTIIIVQGASTGGPITLTVNNPGGIDESTLNSLITQATEAITQQQVIQVQTNPNSAMLQSAQRVIVSQPTLVSTSQPHIVKATLTQNTPQLTASQQPIITTQPQPHKAQLVNQGQLVLSQKQPQLVTSTSNPIVAVSGHQQIIGSSPQYVTVSGNQQIIVNAAMKQNVHRVVQAPRTQAIQPAMVSDKANVNTSSTVPAKVQQQKPMIRQVITRQPVMIGTTKIGEKEIIVHQTVTESSPPPLTPTSNPPSTPAPLTPQPTTQDDTPWICHWKGCAKTFDSANAVYSHAAKAHVPTSATGESPCLWLDCDRVPRRSFALLNHLHDRHCTVDALKAIFMSRKNAAGEADANKPTSLGYPPNAAMAALNKHAVDFLNPRELMDENEGPVTKSIRLTAALILRNIVIYSNTGRRQLRSYEPHLASIALSSVEASRTIAQVLYDMNNI